MRDGFEFERRSVIAFDDDACAGGEQRRQRVSEPVGERRRICVGRIKQHQIEALDSGGAIQVRQRIARDNDGAVAVFGGAGGDLKVAVQHCPHSAIAFDEDDSPGAAGERLDAEGSGAGEEIKHSQIVDRSEYREQCFTNLVGGRPRGTALRTDQAAAFEFTGDYTHAQRKLSLRRPEDLVISPLVRGRSGSTGTAFEGECPVVNTARIIVNTVKGARVVTALAFALAFAFIVTGCGDSSTGTGQQSATIDSTPISIASGNDSKHKVKADSVYQISNDEALQQMHKRVTGANDSNWPSTDFKSRVMYGIELKPTKGGESVDVYEIEQGNGQVIIRANRTKAGEKCPLSKKTTTPYAVYETGPKRGKPRLELTDSIGSTCDGR